MCCTVDKWKPIGQTDIKGSCSGIIGNRCFTGPSFEAILKMY